MLSKHVCKGNKWVHPGAWNRPSPGLLQATVSLFHSHIPRLYHVLSSKSWIHGPFVFWYLLLLVFSERTSFIPYHLQLVCSTWYLRPCVSLYFNFKKLCRGRTCICINFAKNSMDLLILYISFSNSVVFLILLRSEGSDIRCLLTLEFTRRFSSFATFWSL